MRSHGEIHVPASTYPFSAAFSNRSHTAFISAGGIDRERRTAATFVPVPSSQSTRPTPLHLTARARERAGRALGKVQAGGWCRSTRRRDAARARRRRRASPYRMQANPSSGARSASRSRGRCEQIARGRPQDRHEHVIAINQHAVILLERVAIAVQFGEDTVREKANADS